MKNFWKATGIRCLRTFLTTILGVWTADTLITDIDWKATLLAAISTTIYIFVLCIVAGLPEVKYENNLYMNIEEPADSEIKDDENE